MDEPPIGQEVGDIRRHHHDLPLLDLPPTRALVFPCRPDQHSLLGGLACRQKAHALRCFRAYNSAALFDSELDQAAHKAGSTEEWMVIPAALVIAACQISIYVYIVVMASSFALTILVWL